MSHRVVIDHVNNTSTLDLYVAGEFVTSYRSFKHGSIILSDRPINTVISADELKSNVQIVADWFDAIQSLAEVPRVWVQKRVVIDVDINSINVDFRFTPPVKMIDAQYKVSTKMVTFKPRAERTVTVSQFQEYLLVLHDFVRLIDVAQP